MQQDILLKKASEARAGPKSANALFHRVLRRIQRDSPGITEEMAVAWASVLNDVAHEMQP
jgi:hypothetical protein